MNLEETILKVATRNKKFKMHKVMEAVGNSFSRQYINLKLNKLIKEGKLLKTGITRDTFYALPKNKNLLKNIIRKRLKNKSLAEHEILYDLAKKADYLSSLKENVKSIFDYAFSEMLNNAIEHSESTIIDIETEKNKNNLQFIVRDFGIGVFKNVMGKRKLSSELEAIQDLLKGKTTTAPKAHSGEGIFFTSKVADIFILESFGYRLRIDNRINDIFIEEVKPQTKGTKVIFEITLDSKRHLNDVFKEYQSSPEEYAFDKTEIKVKLYTMGTVYISRSQARRILSGLEKFKTVILDFDKVPTIGQAFADEIFRVFKLKHPKIHIVAVNVNETVEFMLKRVG